MGWPLSCEVVSACFFESAIFRLEHILKKQISHFLWLTGRILQIVRFVCQKVTWQSTQCAVCQTWKLQIKVPKYRDVICAKPRCLRYRNIGNVGSVCLLNAVSQVRWVAIHSRWREGRNWSHIWWWWWVLDVIQGFPEEFLTAWDMQLESRFFVWGAATQYEQEEVGDEHVWGRMGPRRHCWRLQELPWWALYTTLVSSCNVMKMTTRSRCKKMSFIETVVSWCLK